MAKRKRLTPANFAVLPEDAPLPRAPETKSLPVAAGAAPIARVAGEVSISAALEEVASEMRAARADGRMIQLLPLWSVDETYLVRDRLAADDDEMSVLAESLKARGQQMPIEVVDLGDGRYGLISGWRRLTALRRLAAADEGPQTVRAVLRRPESASDAYLAMVEENEIRVGLSYWERARIVARSADAGVFRDETQALAQLFAAASRAKRSKIGSFLKLYRALEDRLNHPSAISERLGLALARALEAEPALAERLRERLRKGAPPDAAAETALLERALKGEREPPAPGARPAPEAEAAPEAVPAQVHVDYIPGRLLLVGPGVDAAFAEKVRALIG